MSQLLDDLRARLRARHYSYRTEQSYVDWVVRFIRFHGLRHPRELGAPEVTAFLTHLAVEGQVAASTQNQARAALLFLYRELLELPTDGFDVVVAASKPRRLPVVLTRDEVAAVLRGLADTPLLMAQLLYGSGLRLMECHRLRVKDLDFASHQLTVRDGKGGKDRVTMLPQIRAAPSASSGGAPDPSGRFAGGLRRGAVALRSGREVPCCAARVALAVCVPRNAAFDRPPLRA
jgi:integrase